MNLQLYILVVYEIIIIIIDKIHHFSYGSLMCAAVMLGLGHVIM